jgi:hypothetical protein
MSKTGPVRTSLGANLNLRPNPEDWRSRVTIGEVLVSPSRFSEDEAHEKYSI